VPHGRNTIGRELHALRRSVLSFHRALRRFFPVLAVATRPSSSAASARPARRLSAKARASLVLQGRYMGFMRQLKPKQKAQVRKIREAKGVRAAIARARHLAS